MSFSYRLSFMFLTVTLTLVLSSIPLAGQQNDSPNGTIERINVHGRALEVNVEGDSPDRPVIVYLPPSYFPMPSRNTAAACTPICRRFFRSSRNISVYTEPQR